MSHQRRSEGKAQDARVEAASRYRAQLLAEARPGERGVVHVGAGPDSLLAWDPVRFALAAEVGEPEGVRTLVFDLVIGVENGECVAFRFDRDLGEDAQAAARVIVRALGPERCDLSLLAVASDGYATRSHPDLEAFDEACLEALRAKPL